MCGGRKRREVVSCFGAGSLDAGASGGRQASKHTATAARHQPKSSGCCVVQGEGWNVLLKGVSSILTVDRRLGSSHPLLSLQGSHPRVTISTLG